MNSGVSRNVGGGGCWVRTIGRAAAVGRPEARSAGGRPGVGSGGGPETPSRKGVRGYNPEKILKFYIAKDAFSCIINGIYSAILHLKTRDD